MIAVSMRDKQRGQKKLLTREKMGSASAANLHTFTRFFVT
jgi:hypothetical protein